MLVVESARAVALKLNDPNRVLECIPKSRQLPSDPSIVVIPHRVLEMQRLKELGFNPPSPIGYQYDWPGQFTPYDHQKSTADFLTLHKRCLVLNSIGCVDADTEYLSPTGWRCIADYEGGAVAQYWPDTKRIDFVAEPQFVKLPCDTMLRLKTRYGIDQMLSPEHRVLLQSKTNAAKVETTTAVELLHRHDAWVGGDRVQKSADRVGFSDAAIPTTFAVPGGVGLPLTDAQLRVMVAVIADGYIPEGGNLCYVRVKKQRKKDRLRDLLDAAHIPYSYRECAPEGFHKLSFMPPLRTKVFGPQFWQATPHQLQVIADEVPHWDGTVRENKPRVEFFTSTKESADFVQYAFAACGYTARLQTHERKERGTIEYVVGVSTTKRGSVGILGATGGRRLRSMEYVPSTDGFKYCFMVPSTYLILRRNGCIFATGNTGKTVSALWAADFLMNAGVIKKVLILSPLSTLERVWGDAVFKEFYHRKSVTLYGDAKRRLKMLNTEADFYIINHDGFPIIAKEALDMFDLVIIDEAAVYRNPSTRRFKQFYRWLQVQPDLNLWLMTGTPTPNEPTDAWALAKLVNSPHMSKSYTGFREQVMTKIGQWKFVPRPDSVDIVKHVLQPSIRFTREDCLDLPDTVIQTRKVEMTAEQTKHYKQMVKQLVTEVAGGTITAVNEAVKAQKLIQIALGVAYGEHGERLELDCAPRINAVKEVIEEAGEKVILFVPLTGTLRMLERELSKHWTVAVVNGEVSSAKRNDIFHNFQNARDPRILIAHPATMAHGLTLTAASTVVWYGPITSNEQYVQANGRVERIGKRHVSNVVHIEATEVEHRIYERLQNKQKLQGVLLDLIAQMGKD